MGSDSPLTGGEVSYDGRAGGGGLPGVTHCTIIDAMTRAATPYDAPTATPASALLPKCWRQHWEKAELRLAAAFGDLPPLQQTQGQGKVAISPPPVAMAFAAASARVAGRTETSVRPGRLGVQPSNSQAQPDHGPTEHQDRRRVHCRWSFLTRTSTGLAPPSHAHGHEEQGSDRAQSVLSVLRKVVARAANTTDSVMDVATAEFGAKGRRRR